MLMLLAMSLNSLCTDSLKDYNTFKTFSHVLKLFQVHFTTFRDLIITKKHLANVGVEPTTFALLARRSNQLS